MENTPPLQSVPTPTGISQPSTYSTVAGTDSEIPLSSLAASKSAETHIEEPVHTFDSSRALASGNCNMPRATTSLLATETKSIPVTVTSPLAGNADTSVGDEQTRKRVFKASLASQPLSIVSSKAALRLWDLRSQDPSEEELLQAAGLTGFLGESFGFLRTASFPPNLQASWIALMVGFLRIEETRGFPKYKVRISSLSFIFTNS
jgi:hypothetical protein